MIRFFSNAVTLLILCLYSSALWASDPLWIDVRNPDEYSAGHVDGAVNIPYTEIGARIGEVTEDKDLLIYVYCRSGRRSGIAQNTLQEAGFSHVVNVGGLEDAMARAAETTLE